MTPVCNVTTPNIRVIKAFNARHPDSQLAPDRIRTRDMPQAYKLYKLLSKHKICLLLQKFKSKEKFSSLSMIATVI